MNATGSRFYLRRQPLPWVIAALAIAAQLVLRFTTSTPSHSDENIYLYAARRIAEGAVPYRDFFFAHPPLQPYLLWLIQPTEGFVVWTMRLLPFAGSALCLISVFVLFARRGLAWSGAFATALAGVSYGFLHHGQYGYGWGLAIGLGCLGVAAFDWASQENHRGWLIASGVGWGLAILCRFSVLAVLVGFVGALVLTNQSRPYRQKLAALATALGAACLTLVAGLAPFAILAGSEMWESLVVYHKQKDPGAGLAETLELLFVENFWLVTFATLGAVGKPVLSCLRVGRVLTWAHTKSFLACLRTDDTWCLGWGGALMAVLALWLTPQRFGYYLLVAYPALLVLAGTGLNTLILAWGCTAESESRRRWLALTLAMMAGGLFLFKPALLPATGVHRLTEDIGRFAANCRQHEFRGIEAWKERIGSAPEAPEANTILGDSMQAPLLAVATGRSLPGGEVDLNPLRWKAFPEHLAAFVEGLTESPPQHMVLLDDEQRGDWMGQPGFRAWLAAQNYQRAGRFEGLTLFLPGD